MINVPAVLADRGYQGVLISIRRIDELRRELEEYRRSGFFDEKFFRERLTGFKFTPPERLPGAESLILIAAPQPQISVRFKWKRRDRSLIIPPTYLYYPNRDVERLLKSVLGGEGYRLAKTSLPLKSLAVHSGLGAYGRNNICYIHGMGSYHRLMAFHSDMPCRKGHWQEPRIMESCLKCQACLSACPTGAISKDRFLIRAEYCLTYLNESRGEFPAWLDPSWHHCLMGCMKCQDVCPENRKYRGWVEERQVFSEKETALILRGTSAKNLSASTLKKLKDLDLLDDYNLLPRNLRAVLPGG